jgi:hypothetical protein
VVNEVSRTPSGPNSGNWKEGSRKLDMKVPPRGSSRSPNRHFRRLHGWHAYCGSKHLGNSLDLGSG